MKKAPAVEMMTILVNKKKCSEINTSLLGASAHLVDVYVVVVRRVVDGFEEALELAGGSSVDGEDKCDADRL